MCISVFGLGYVGCVTAASLANDGHTVVGAEVNAEKVRQINASASPVGEPGLPKLLASVVQMGRLRATTDIAEAVAASDLAMICVGTPSGPHGRLSLGAVERVARDIGCALCARRETYTVVVRSTVLPGTTERAILPALLDGAGPGAARRVRVAVNPEFMREGSSLRDFAQPPMTLVGCADSETGALVRSLYPSITAPFVQTGIRTAEIVKYACNAFHALKVCFSNEIGDLCDAFDIDPQEVMRIFLMDRKLNVSEAYLRPGFAFGGSCLPKDLRALLGAGRSADLTLPLLSTLLPANDARIRRAVDAVMDTGKRRIGVVGLAFKAGTDDLRESPMVALVEGLIGKGCDVRVLDRGVALPRLVGANQRYIQDQIPHIASLMCDDANEILRHAEVLVIGNAGLDAANVLDAADERHIVLDLTRGQLQSTAKALVTIVA
ncbi:MAG: UDP-glucose/GDP-mannose dehydrogenase family protein [Acidobacteria bacterium]|nr:UDP-glucose/GDP-mannose dehydrogenase family protein [Acidobacteriota bacterium]